MLGLGVMDTMIPTVLDVDPGIDDALALLLAWGSPELDVLALTVVAGTRRSPTPRATPLDRSPCASRLARPGSLWGRRRRCAGHW